MEFHFRPKWSARLNAAIYWVGHYRPKWASCLLGAVLLFVCSFCVLIGWCFVQSESRLAEEEWEAIRAMKEKREPSSPVIAKPLGIETREP